MKLKTVITLLIILFLSGSIYTQELTKEEKRARKKETRKLLKNSLNFIKADKLDSAIILLDSLIILDPKNADAYYQKGWVAAQKADSALAIEILEQGVRQAPLSTRLRILLIRLKIESGDIDGAIPHLDSILSIKPNEGETLYLKGLTLLKKNDTANAVTAFKKAMDIAFKKGNK